MIEEGEKKYFNIVEETQKEVENYNFLLFNSYFTNLINLFEEKLHTFLSYIILNCRIETGKKEREKIILKNLVIYLSIIYYTFFIKH